MPTAFTKEVFGLDSVQDMITEIKTFLVDETGFFAESAGAIPYNSTSGSAYLIATNLVDGTLPATPQDGDLVWALNISEGNPNNGGADRQAVAGDPAAPVNAVGTTLPDYANGTSANDPQIDDGRNDQLVISWGLVEFRGIIDPQGSEIVPDPALRTTPVNSRQWNMAVMTATEDPNNPGHDTLSVGPANLHGLRMTVTARGVTIAAYSQSEVSSWKDFGLLSIQRPVDCDGLVLTTGKAPLFAVWNSLDPAPEGGDLQTAENLAEPTGDGDVRWFKAVIRESDQFTSLGSQNPISYDPTNLPTTPPPGESRADTARQIQFDNRETLYGWPTRWEQPIVQDNAQIPLVFPFGLTTSRFSYLEEMDQVCVGPGCVFTFGQIIDLTVFGEARKYQMLTPSADCNGVVPGILVDGPEFL